MIILNLLLRYYKDQFARIWFFSPSIKLDPQYAPLRKYLEKMVPDHEKEPLYFEDLEQPVLGKLLDDQRKITEDYRKKKIKPPQVCVILDDLADRGDLLTKRQGGDKGSWLVSLATRGRHFGVTWIISSQVLNLVGTVLRKNLRAMCVLRGAFWDLRREDCDEFIQSRDRRSLLVFIRQTRCEDSPRYVLVAL